MEYKELKKKITERKRNGDVVKCAKILGVAPNSFWTGIKKDDPALLTGTERIIIEMVAAEIDRREAFIAYYLQK